MDWIILFIAGLFEIGFTTFLKLSNHFTRTGPTIGFLVFAFLSFYFLSLSLKSIPIGTSYAIWTGIGATGTALIGIIFFGEPATPLRLFFLTTIIASLIGLKLVS